MGIYLVQHLTSSNQCFWFHLNVLILFFNFKFVFLYFVGKHTWHDDLRGRAHDHTIDNFLTPTQTQNNDAPPNLTINEAINLGYYPKRDDFEVNLLV